MDYSNSNGLTDDARPTAPAAQFFLAPESPLQRQYEALRCFFVEGLPSQQVATRFGYSPGAFRVLCHQFRHDPSKRARFFQAIRRGPQAAPAGEINPQRWLSCYLESCAESGNRAPPQLTRFLPWEMDPVQRAAWGRPSGREAA